MTRQALFGTRADAKRFATSKKRVLGGEKPRTTEKAFSEAEQVSSRWFRQFEMQRLVYRSYSRERAPSASAGPFWLFHEAEYDE